MADTNDDLLDGELEGDFGELDAEEEDALLADDDYMYQTGMRSTQRSVYIEEEEEDEIEEKTDSTGNKFYTGAVEEIQEVAEGDEILEEEEDVLDLGVVDELESELDDGHTQGMQHAWRIQEPLDKNTVSEGGQKLNRPNLGAVKVETVNVSSSTGVKANVGVESDEDDDEERRGRFKSERSTNSNIISLKSPLKKSLSDIPDTLDNVVPAGQMHGLPSNRGMWRGPNRGRGGFQQKQPSVMVSVEKGSEQMQGFVGNMRGMWRGPNRGRGGFQRPMRPPMQGIPQRRPPMMGPFPMNQGIRPLRPQQNHQQNMNFAHNPKIHVNPHFRGSEHQGPNIRPEWDETGQHQQSQGPPGTGPPFIPQPQPLQREGSWGHESIIPEPPMMQQDPNYYQPQQPHHQQQPVQYMQHNPEPQVFHNPQAQQPPHDRLVQGNRITIQTNFQQPHGPNFEEFSNRPFNNEQFTGPNNIYPNQQNMQRPGFPPQNFEEQYPPRIEYQEPMPPQPQHQFNQEFQPNEWNQGQAGFISPSHQPPPPQFYGREHQPMPPPPPPQQQMFRPPGPVLRPPLHRQQQFQPPIMSPLRGQFRGGIRGRLGAPDSRILNKRNSNANQVNNEIPFKQTRFEQRKGGPVMSNLHEVQTVDNLPPEVLPDTTTEPEEEDEETKQYRKQIEEQKKIRETVMALKEARRQQAAAEKRKEQLSQKIAVVKNEWSDIDDGPPGVDPEPNQQNITPVISSPAVNTPSIKNQSVPVRGGLNQRGRGSVHTRIGMKIIEDKAATPTPETFVLKADMQPTVTVTSSGICLPTTYKEVRVRTKDGTIVRRKTPVLLDGSQLERSNIVLTRSIQQGNYQQLVLGKPQQGLQHSQHINANRQIVRGENIPVRAQGIGRGGIRRGGATLPRGQGVIPAPSEAPKKPLTVGQRFAMQKNKQQIQSTQPQTKSNRIVMPAGLLQITAAVNTVPIPNSCLLTIDNLSASTTRAAISKMAQQVGKVKKLKLDTTLKRAVLRFYEPSSAAMFFQRFQRKMVDLSMINVTVVPE